MQSISTICPRCGSGEGFRRLHLGDRATSFVMFFLGGIIPWLLYESARQHKIVCISCGHAFDAPIQVSPSRLRFLAGILICVVIIAAVVLFFVLRR